MAAGRAPKQWKLTTHETITTFESWRQNLLYILSLDNNFSPFIAPNFTWQKLTSTNQLRGLVDDADPIPAADRKTAVQKNTQLELMLGQIANFCPVISRNSILKNSTSINDIWHKIRQHFGFQSTGARFLDLATLKLQHDERPEDLFQRIMAFFEDNLLTVTGGITHHGEVPTSDEDLTPSLENTVVVIWLQLIHQGLPQLVQQKYGSELRNKTLASLKPEISQALPSLLDELRAIEDSKVLRASSNFMPRRKFSSFNKRNQTKSCILCKTAGRPYVSHNLSDCHFLPDADRRGLAKSRLVNEDDLSDAPDFEPAEEDHTISAPTALLDPPTIHRVNVIQSPFLNAYYLHHPLCLILDTGATTNMIKASLAQAIDLPMKPASQMARQADGVTPLDVIGEVHCQLTRDGHTFALDALVVKQLDVDILAGNPFLVTNDIATRPAKRQIVIGGTDVISYGPQSQTSTSIRRTQAFLLRSPSRQTVLMPGDFIDLPLPTSFDPDTTCAIEPRLDSPSNQDVKFQQVWPPAQEVISVGSNIRLLNSTQDPVLLKKNEHFCQVRSVSQVDGTSDNLVPGMPVKPPPAAHVPYSSNVSVDPNQCLPHEVRAKFSELHQQYDTVFCPRISKYNGHSGSIEAVVNMGTTLPPQRKGRLPHYNRDTLIELQNKFDELEVAGVFAKPEQVNVTVEYLNLSFLVRKPNGGSRLVTSFGEVGQYSKPQPSLMPNVDSVLRDIGRWKYLIVTDLLQSFYQIPLAHKSMKYCGVATPFKGIRVYTRCAMGMPGSETCLEELMSRVLGDLIQEGCVAKIADDLYCGGDTPDDVLFNWSRVLAALQLNNLRLNASKTIICPQSTTVLGWIWSAGTLKASPHKVTALTTVKPPSTVNGLRSFIGAYKVLSRVLHGYASLLDPLEQATAGKQSSDHISWSTELTSAFHDAQAALAHTKTISIPCPNDCLWIVTDGSVKNRGLAATLYALRDDKLLLCGFFNAKLKKHQGTWLPCEIEALAIAAAVKHFAPVIIQAKSPCQILTDSRPCVQAYDKLRRGEFSASSRVTTFLSVVSRYHLQVRHISGAANLPSDYTSRHPTECSDQSCQVCVFVKQSADSVIRNLTVKDVIDGSATMPFTNRAAWIATQQECADLRRTHSHLTQGTRPSKKQTKIPDVKRYLRQVTVARDGLLIVQQDLPFQGSHESIVVPRNVLHGLLTALHIRFSHPSSYQLKQLFNRYFYALDLDKAIQALTDNCHHCNSLKSLPIHLHPQSTSIPPSSIGTHFAADIMKRYRQLILVLREVVSAFTLTCFIDSERHQDLRAGILVLCADVRSLGNEGVLIRVDPAPGFRTLTQDPTLKEYGIVLDVGYAKNANKNPVAERAIEELGIEFLKLSPEGGPLSGVTLAMATANLNSRIRKGGLSAREIWTQRDQITGQQLPLEDRELILQQHHLRMSNHPASAKSKAHGKPCAPAQDIHIGDLVFLKADRNKYQARDKYIVTSVKKPWCEIRKFTKSQFRSRTYDVRICDCYPVLPDISTSQSPGPGPIRGLDHDDNSDSDDSLVCLPDYDQSAHAHPPAPDAIVAPLNGPPAPQPVAHDVVPAAPAGPVAYRRSSRATNRPLWQQSDDWVIY
jgi:hypothetical protein